MTALRAAKEPSTINELIRHRPGFSAAQKHNHIFGVQKKKTARPHPIRAILSRIFQDELGQKSPSAMYRSTIYDNTTLDHKTLEELNIEGVSKILYWYCTDLTFNHTDFQRIFPTPSYRSANYGPEWDSISFDVVRARNPVNLTRWMGYFLKFESEQAALIYFRETLGAELCGMPVKLRFVDETTQGLSCPHLQKVPGLPRECHALVLGLPQNVSATTILRALWDYELLDDDSLAVERLPMDNVKYGGKPVLLRFFSKSEAQRFARDFDRTVFPYTSTKVYCEVID